MRGHYYWDGEEYCDSCLPVRPEMADWDTGEQDTPAHCGECGKLLDYSLTSDGVDYVLKKLIESIDNKEYEIMKPGQWPEGDYYHNCPIWACELDWAEDLQWYSLDKCQKFVVDRYLELFRKANKEFWANDHLRED